MRYFRPESYLPRIQIIILVVLLCCKLGESACIGREFRSGGEKRHTNVIKINIQKCSKLDKLSCVDAHHVCFWVPNKEKTAFLEGPSIASAKYVDVQMLSKEQFASQWGSKGDVDAEALNRLQTRSTDTDLKKNFKILTAGRDNVWYEMTPTSWDAHKKEMDRISTLYKEHVARNEKKRRLTIPQTVANTQQAPYSSVGVLKVFQRDHSADAPSATATIIHKRKDLKVNGKGYVYVLAAAHDMIKPEAGPGSRMFQFAPLNEYSFYPNFMGSKASRKATIYPNALYHLERAWVLDYHYGEYITDVAILKFVVEQKFEDFLYPKLEIKNQKIAAEGVYNMVVYDKNKPHFHGVFYQQKQAPVHLSCDENKCEYKGVQILAGYCGGPIFPDGSNDIVAMQVARHGEGGSYVCERGSRELSKCTGYAVKISGALLVSIGHVTVFDNYQDWKEFSDYPVSTTTTTTTTTKQPESKDYIPQAQKVITVGPQQVKKAKIYSANNNMYEYSAKVHNLYDTPLLDAYDSMNENQHVIDYWTFRNSHNTNSFFIGFIFIVLLYTVCAGCMMLMCCAFYGIVIYVLYSLQILQKRETNIYDPLENENQV